MMSKRHEITRYVRVTWRYDRTGECPEYMTAREYTMIVAFVQDVRLSISPMMTLSFGDGKQLHTYYRHSNSEAWGFVFGVIDHLITQIRLHKYEWIGTANRFSDMIDIINASYFTPYRTVTSYDEDAVNCEWLHPWMLDCIEPVEETKGIATLNLGPVISMCLQTPQTTSGS